MRGCILSLVLCIVLLGPSLMNGHTGEDMAVRDRPGEPAEADRWSKTTYTGNARGAAPASAIAVGIYNLGTTSGITYWTGTNSNTWSTYQSAMTSDPQSRFTTSVITDLSSSTLSGLDVLILPDNAVPNTYLTSVSNWFANGKGIVCVDSAACYGAYSGFLFPGSASSNGLVPKAPRKTLRKGSQSFSTSLIMESMSNRRRQHWQNIWNCG